MPTQATVIASKTRRGAVSKIFNTQFKIAILPDSVQHKPFAGAPVRVDFRSLVPCGSERAKIQGLVPRGTLVITPHYR